MSTIVSNNAFHTFTLDSLSRRGTDRPAFDDWAEAQVPRILSGESLTEVLDRLDGTDWAGRVVDLGNSYAAPVFRRLRAILARIVKDCRE